MNASLLQERHVHNSAYTKDQLALLNPQQIPHHVAIIMDGNRRWSKRLRLPLLAGHWKGAETLSDIVRAAADLGIKVLTVYAFSTENWSRSKEEVEGIMRLLETYLIAKREAMIKDGVKLNVIGDISKLPSWLLDTLNETKQATSLGNRIELVLAINYGGRDDIRRAVTAIVDDVEKGKIRKEEISENLIARYLDTAQWRDPELIIRTSGENRLSNFLLWQISYSEVYITDILWPDFGSDELLRAILVYQQRERRLGGK